MAKRRKLTAPSAADLSRIEDEFRRETRVGAMAPIAQVAAETAGQAEVLGAETRARIARAEADAEGYREAQGKGLIIQQIPLDQINADEMFRDRMTMSREELDELRASIATNGLRLPIEVFELADGDGLHRYGLISGYRRLLAMRELHQVTQKPEHSTIKTVVREPKSSADSFAAIVEENEIRASLSHFERGRFAALTAANGIFTSVEEAVQKLFPFASKAKRSKVRSFALIFEEIGDMLEFPEALTEKQGLRLASALRAGAERDLRGLLAEARAGDAREEWAIIEELVSRYEDEARDPKRGGRPSKRVVSGPEQSFRTTGGVDVSWGGDSASGYVIKLQGRGLHPDVMDSLLTHIRYVLGSPED